VDRLGETYAVRNKLPIAKFPADWDKWGKPAGYIRNKEMAQYADALVAVWNGESKGTKHMIDLAKEQGLKVHIHYVKD
jgi:glycerophosphoryl diester phosphodiesterase